MSVTKTDGQRATPKLKSPAATERKPPAARSQTNKAAENKAPQPKAVKDGLELVSHADVVKAKAAEKKAAKAAQGMVGSTKLNPGQEVSVEVATARGISFEGSVKMGRVQAEPGLKNFATIEASGSMSLVAEASNEAKKKPITVNGSIAKGVKVTFEAKVTAAQAQAIQQGKGQLPNPFEPQKMAEGTAAVLKGEHFTSLSLGAAYKNIAAELGYTNSSGMAIGVEKASATQVKVTAGPYKAVENEAFLGVNSGSVTAGLSLTRGLEESKAKTVTIDISKPEGRDAYMRLLTTGKFPKDDASKGISQSANIEAVKVTGNASAVAKFGPVANSFNLGGNEGELKKTTFPNGTAELEATVRYQDGKAAILTRNLDKTGKEDAGQTTAKLLAGRNSGNSTAAFYAAFAKDWNPAKFKEISSGPPRDIQIQVNNQQAKQIADMARQYITQVNKRDFNSAPEGLMKQLARATTAQEFAKVFAKHEPAAVAAELVTLRRTLNQDKPVAGWFSMQKSP